jgi:uncharacterized protein
MSTNRDLIQSLYAAFAEGDAATVLGAMHPEVEWNEAESSPYADQNPYVGPGRVGEGVFGRIMADFPNFAVSPEQFVADGEVVVAMGRYRGTHKVTRKALDAQFTHAWTIRNGKVVRFQQYTDTAQYHRVMND